MPCRVTILEALEFEATYCSAYARSGPRRLESQPVGVTTLPLQHACRMEFKLRSVTAGHGGEAVADARCVR